MTNAAKNKIAFAKALAEVVCVDGQTFYFGPGFPETEKLSAELAKHGFHEIVLPRDGRTGLCWEMGR